MKAYVLLGMICKTPKERDEFLDAFKEFDYPVEAVYIKENGQWEVI